MEESPSSLTQERYWTEEKEKVLMVFFSGKWHYLREQTIYFMKSLFLYLVLNLRVIARPLHDETDEISDT